MATYAVIEFLLSGVVDLSGNPLSGGLCYAYEAGTTTPKNLYENSDGTSPLNEFTLNAFGCVQLYGQGTYRIVINDSDNVNVYDYDNLTFGSASAAIDYVGSELTNVGAATATTSAVNYLQLQNGAPQFIEDITGTANAIVLTSDITVASLVIGQHWIFKATATNTSAVTADVDGTGTTDVKKAFGTALTALAPGDIIIGGAYHIIYDGTQYILLNPSGIGSVQNGSVFYGGTSGGSANAQTVTLSPAIASLTTGQIINYTAGYTNTGAMTLNPNGIGATAVKLETGGDLPAATVVAGQRYAAFYNGTNFTHIELGYSRVISRTASMVSVQNSSAETDLLSITIPANTLVTGRILRVSAFGHVADGLGGGGTTFTFKFKLGSTTLSSAISVTSGTESVKLDALLIPDSLTTQMARFSLNEDHQVSESYAENGGTDLALKLTVTNSRADLLVTSFCYASFVELL